MGKVSIEKLRHKEAFEHYYGLGIKRNYRTIASVFKVSPHTIEQWGKDFNWQKRVEKRDKENAKALVKRTDKKVRKDALIVLKTKVDARALIQKYINVIDRTLSKLIVKDKEGNETIKVNLENTNDIDKMINALERLTKLDMQLANELKEDNSTEQQKEVIIQFIQNNLGEKDSKEKELKRKAITGKVEIKNG